MRRSGQADTFRTFRTFYVQWSEDVIKADPFFGRSWVRFRVPPPGFEHNCT